MVDVPVPNLKGLPDREAVMKAVEFFLSLSEKELRKMLEEATATGRQVSYMTCSLGEPEIVRIYRIWKEKNTCEEIAIRMLERIG